MGTSRRELKRLQLNIQYLKSRQQRLLRRQMKEERISRPTIQVRIGDMQVIMISVLMKVY